MAAIEGDVPTRRTVLHPATKHFVLAALRRGRLPGASERHSCPPRHRWLVLNLRAHTDAEFREAVTEAAALDTHDELYSKHIEPAPEDVEWAMAEASDDEDDAAHARRATRAGAD